MFQKHYPLSRVSYLLNSLVFLSALLSVSVHAQSSRSAVGVVGDDLSLGVSTHPAVSEDLGTLKKIALGEITLKAKEDERLYKFNMKGELSAPTVLWPGIREYFGTTDWVRKHLNGTFESTVFSTPQYSWSYMVSRKMNVDAEKIFLAAEMGAKLESLPRQVDRLLDANKGELPASVFIFFGADELCANFMNAITSAEDFGNSLLRGLKYLARNGDASSEGTRVYVPYFLPISQLVTKESILSYKFENGTSCRDVRKSGWQLTKEKADLSIEAIYLSAFLPPSASNKCPTLFNLEFLASNQVGFFSNFNAEKKQAEIVQLTRDYTSLIATRIRNYRVQTDIAVRAANEWISKKMPQKKISFIVIKETGDVEFEGADLAPDCFHLNISGQAKIADAILSSIEPKELPVEPKPQAAPKKRK